MPGWFLALRLVLAIVGTLAYIVAMQQSRKGQLRTTYRADLLFIGILGLQVGITLQAIVGGLS